MIANSLLRQQWCFKLARLSSQSEYSQEKGQGIKEQESKSSKGEEEIMRKVVCMGIDNSY